MMCVYSGALLSAGVIVVVVRHHRDISRTRSKYRRYPMKFYHVNQEHVPNVNVSKDRKSQFSL